MHGLIITIDSTNYMMDTTKPNICDECDLDCISRDVDEFITDGKYNSVNTKYSEPTLEGFIAQTENFILRCNQTSVNNETCNWKRTKEANNISWWGNKYPRKKLKMFK